MRQWARGVPVVVVASLLMACGGDSSVGPPPTSGGGLPGDPERNPQNISILWRSPGDGATITTRACGSVYVLPLEMGVMARHDEALARPFVFVELFNSGNRRCASGSSTVLRPLPAGEAGTFVIRQFFVSPEEVPNPCSYPAAIVFGRATLVSGSGSIPALPQHAIRNFPMNLRLSGSTDPLSVYAGPCPP